MNQEELAKINQIITEGKINELDSDGNTALMNACRCERVEIVKLLLNIENLDVNAKNKFENTVLIYAFRNGHVDILNLLIDHGAEFIGDIKKWEQKIQYTLKSGFTIKGPNEVTNKYFECLKILSNHFEQVETLIIDIGQRTKMQEYYNKFVAYLNEGRKKSAYKIEEHESEFALNIEEEDVDVPALGDDAEDNG